MLSHLRKLFAAGLLLAVLAGVMAGSSSAANLTGGNTTYVINGEEAMFPFDPIKLGMGLLLPLEVFQRFGIAVEGAAAGRNITLKKAGVSAATALGSTSAQLNGRPLTLTAASVRLNGRLFVPADLLRHFGIEVQQDGSYLIFQDYTEGMPALVETDATALSNLSVGRTFLASPKADSNIFLQADFLLLSTELLSASSLSLDYGTRVRLNSLLQTNTLVWVSASNWSAKAGGLATAGFFLVDDKRNQYDLVSVFDTGSGLLNAKLAPGATRTGVLVFPKLDDTAGYLNLYYDNNGAILGTFTRLK